MAIRNGKARDEGWRVRKNGTTFWGSILITAIHDATGKTIGFGKLTRDLTDKKLAEQAQFMFIKNKELEQFNYIASHDLQEPLRTVSNYIQVLEEDYFGLLPDEAKKHLRTIEGATNRMRILVKSLLDLSRLGRDNKIAPVDCHLLVKTVLADLHSLIETTKSEIGIIDTLPEILAYETEIRQLFQNLITNAIKFRRKDLPARIKIGYTEKDSSYEFYVQDNGVGIEQKHFERIFQIFQRLNKSGSVEGYGIGLTNCRKIVEIHGGKIWVESELSKGSTFKFTIIKV